MDVWHTSLDLQRDPPPQAAKLLSGSERERAAAMATVPGRRFAAARIALRRLLAGYLGTAPGSIHIAYGPHGRPHLETAGATSILHFNLSHSGDRALFAFGSAPLGVDLERIRAVPLAERLAERFFAPGERRTLGRTAPHEQQPAFFACWTRKEAYLKAAGGALAPSFKLFEVAFVPGQRPAILASDGSPRSEWSLKHLEPEPGWVGALAIRRPACVLRCWRLAAETSGHKPRPSMNDVS